MLVFVDLYVVKQPTFAPCHLLFYLTDVADDMNNMTCTLSKIDTMIFFSLHLCLLCWHGSPVVWWRSPHYKQCQIMLLIFWTYSLFSNLKLDGIDNTVHLCLYTCKTCWGSPGLGGVRIAELSPLAGLLDYEDTRLKTSSRVRMGLSLAWKASLAIRICRSPTIVTDSV